MRAVLLVKTSSLGDVVHNLPVASDVAAAYPEAEIDWVTEESLGAIPRLHPAVRRVIPVAVRRWRVALWQTGVWREVRDFLFQLRRCRYDAVIDTQGLLKSALISRAACGRRHGLDWSSSREPLAVFYDRTYDVPWGRHAVERNRSLAAQAMGYAMASSVNYGIRATRRTFSWLPGQPYLVMLHATSAASKLWPEARWIELGNIQTERGVCSVLPWGSEDERVRAVRLAAAIPSAIVPPRMTLDDAAGLLAGAYAVAGVDTGLTHLAAALGVPTAGIFCATDPSATGIYGCAQAVNLGGIGQSPAAGEVVTALEAQCALPPGTPASPQGNTVPAS